MCTTAVKRRRNFRSVGFCCASECGMLQCGKPKNTRAGAGGGYENDDNVAFLVNSWYSACVCLNGCSALLQSRSLGLPVAWQAMIRLF